MENEGGFGVFVEHIRYDDGTPDGLWLHVPRLGSRVDYDMGDEPVWDERIRETVRAAVVALGIL